MKEQNQTNQLLAEIKLFSLLLLYLSVPLSIFGHLPKLIYASDAYNSKSR